MKGNLGRKRQISAFVVTGNKNGSTGISLGKAVESKAALRKAKNRAGQKLMYIEICNNHTGMFKYFMCICVCEHILNHKDISLNDFSIMRSDVNCHSGILV
jgi:hypothetical protein